MDAQSIYDYAAQSERTGIQTKLVSVPLADHVTGAFPDGIGSQGYRRLTFNWLTEHGLAPNKNKP
ncbi:MAG TPA: hypothetical protein VNB22_11950 [Pyrinomonadaceae bacterium]|nr:hypothetical protein [Pyrinomonadaceae bacterium]